MFAFPRSSWGRASKRVTSPHEIYDHCSVAATAYDRFDLSSSGVGYINERHKQSTTLADCIDPNFDPNNFTDEPDIPVMEFSESELMDWERKYRFDGQPGLAQMVDSGQIPRDQDLRPCRRENLLEFLENGAELGAFKVTQ